MLIVSLLQARCHWPVLHITLVSALLHTVTYTAHFLPSFSDPSSQLLPDIKDAEPESAANQNTLSEALQFC